MEGKGEMQVFDWNLIAFFFCFFFSENDVISTVKIPFNAHFGWWLAASLIFLNVTARCS